MFRNSNIGRSMARGLLFSIVLGTPIIATGHGRAGWDTIDGERAIEFPDTANYVTLVADLHTHSVFSDGHVWPNVRVAEAQRDGLDAVAITEHLEYQPHRQLLPNLDRNSAFKEALAAAAGSQLIVVSGSEITRQAPAGHINAVFLQDANALFPIPEGAAGPSALSDAVNAWPVENAVAAANEQGAFVFWNHAWWSTETPNRHTKMTDLHKSLIDKGQLHGIEIVNGNTYNEEAHQLALDHDLTFIGTSEYSQSDRLGIRGQSRWPSPCNTGTWQNPFSGIIEGSLIRPSHSGLVQELVDRKTSTSERVTRRWFDHRGRPL